MIPGLALIELLAADALRPGAVSLAARIFDDDVAVARGAERTVQPGDLLLQTQPFRIDRDRCEECHGSAQARDRDANLMHGLGVAGACARVVGLDRRDAVERNLLECVCAVESCFRGGLAPAGAGLGGSPSSAHTLCPASNEAEALRSVWSGVPEASIICQFTAPIAKVSCFITTSAVASDASPLRCRSATAASPGRP